MSNQCLNAVLLLCISMLRSTCSRSRVWVHFFVSVCSHVLLGCRGDWKGRPDLDTIADILGQSSTLNWRRATVRCRCKLRSHIG